MAQVSILKQMPFRFFQVCGVLTFITFIKSVAVHFDLSKVWKAGAPEKLKWSRLKSAKTLGGIYSQVLYDSAGPASVFLFPMYCTFLFKVFARRNKVSKDLVFQYLSKVIYPKYSKH